MLSVLVLLRPAVCFLFDLFFDFKLLVLSLFGESRAFSIAYELGIGRTFPGRARLGGATPA